MSKKTVEKEESVEANVVTEEIEMIESEIITEEAETIEIENTQLLVIEEKKKEKKKPRHPILIKVIKAFLIAIIVLLILLYITAGVLYYEGCKIYNAAEININDLSIKYNNSIVKDMQGNTIAGLSGDENRQIISLSDMPEYLPKAFISIEDERFYTNNGVDLKRTARSSS